MKGGELRMRVINFSHKTRMPILRKYAYACRAQEH